MQSKAGSVQIVGVADRKFTFNPKEGIDNPVMVITDDTDSEPAVGPRLCILKREEVETYGFHLRVEKGHQGHIIRNVVSGGVGERCGLRDGDRLLEINNCYVDDLPHPEVARKIKLSGNQLGLLVVDGGVYEKAVSQGQNPRGLISIRWGEGCKPPRLCHITKDPVSGLGINFTPVGGEKGQFSVNLISGGAAEKAGVRRGDHLVWMDGAAVSDLTHAALSLMLKKCGNHITILVIDSESEKNYAKQRMPILPTFAIPSNLPYTAKKFNLVSRSDGYGFLLRLEKTPSGRTFHFLREVESGSTAEGAGIKDGELLLEVNGESTETLKHDDVVDIVRLSGKKVCLTTISFQGMEFYTKLGLSPLLFCEDSTDEKEKESNPTELSQQEGEVDLYESRLCLVQKGRLGFGFNLGHDPNRPGPFISHVVPGGPGRRAGLHVGDVVLEVNGQNVAKKYVEDVIVLVKEGGNFLSLRITDKENYNKGAQRKLATRDTTETQQEDDDYEISYL